MVEILLGVQVFLCALPWLFVVRKRLHPLSAPIVCGLLFAHPYVAQPIARLLGGLRLITPEMLEFGLLVSSLALAAFYLGWLWGRGVQKPSGNGSWALDSQRLMIAAAALTVLAVIGWIVFAGGSGGVGQLYSEKHGQAANWLGVSGYIYNLPAFLAPAVCLLLLAAGLPGPRPRQSRAYRGAIALSGAWLVHVILMGSRGGFFLLAAPWLVFLIGRRGMRTRTVLQSVIGLGVVAFGFQFIVVFRDFTHLGSTDWKNELFSEERWQQVVTYNTFLPDPSLRGNTEIDYHCAETYLFWQNGEYSWGAALINPIINFLPRHLFPDKASMMLRPVSRREVLFRGVGWEPNPGSCPTGPGEMFTEFGFFSLMFWFLIGAVMARVDATLGSLSDPRQIGYYAGALCGLLHLVLQSYGAGFMAYLFFTGPLWVGFRYARSRRIIRLAVRAVPNGAAPARKGWAAVPLSAGRAKM